MKILVMKFGGTSVATADARKLAAQRVASAKEQGWSPVVVVSAIGRKGAPYATDTLIGAVQEVDPNIATQPHDLDLIMGCGEIVSAVVFSQTLRSHGVKARAITGAEAGIFTDTTFGNARIEQVEPWSVRAWLEQGITPVVCGFQGVFGIGERSPVGELTTLGRGGSDTTASALGAALRADAVEIFTDVDGIKTADPDYVANTPTLRRVSYHEVAEIAHLGATVIHPRAAEIAMKYGIPLWVKNTFSEDVGTEIVPQEEISGRNVTGVTHTGKLEYLQFDFSSVRHEHAVAIPTAIFEMLGRYGLNLYMLNMNPTGLGFGVPRTQFQTVKDLLDGLVLPLGSTEKIVYLFQIGDSPSKEVETQAAVLQGFAPLIRVVATLTEACTMVSLVGHKFLQRPGVYLAVLKTLTEAHITVLQTSDSDFSVSCLVPEADSERAVRLLHDRFELSGIN